MGYITDFDPSNTGQVPAITATGATGIAIPALTGFNYSTIKVLWVDEPNNGSPSADFGGAVAAISAFVSSGGVFVYNSRNVSQGTPDSSFLPGGGAISLTSLALTDIDVGAVTPLTSGPFGTITNTTLDGGNFSEHGFATTSSLPAGATVHLIVGPAMPTEAVAFSYKFGSGTVFYSTIPLDFYLGGAGNDPPATAMRTIYTPNMIAFACGLTGGGCATHMHGHTFLFGHANPAAHFFGHVATDPRHGHHFICANHAPGHTPYIGAHLQPEAGEEMANPGFVAGLNQDGSANPAKPAARGTVLQLFGSAAGIFLGAEDDEEPAGNFTPPASGMPLYSTTSLPEVRIGGVAAKVLFSGLAPGLTGVWQINVQIPEEAPAGKLPVTITYEGYELRSVDITVQ